MGRGIGLSGLALALALSACDGGGGGPDAATADGASVCLADTDCDDGLFCNGVERCLSDSSMADAAGCVRGGDPCIAGQRCDDAMDQCLSNCAVVPDADGDGVDAIECGGADCDDTNPNRYPGAVEVCDADDVDEDCDPLTFGERDADGDGFLDATCCNTGEEGTRHCGDDCSDSRRDMRPGFAETCDFLDNDCDGAVDEAVAVDGFADEDRDLHGDPASPMRACPDTRGFSVVDDDCDDDDPEVHGAQLEICDRKDNDCDGTTDESPASVTWYADEDDDGFGAAGGRTVVSCEPVPGFSLRSSDCDDNDRNRNPAARELCNGEDDDCDGRADFMIRPGDFEDDDDDGFADMACGGNDCEDRDGSIHPGAQELCDGIDNDCDGRVDGDSAMANWYLDLDGDGFGDEAQEPIADCDPQPGRVPRGGDCDDSSAAIHPGVPDRCDGRDEDCDGATDESAVRLAYYVDGDGDGFGDSASPVTFSCFPVSGRASQPGDCDDGDDSSFPAAPELCDLRDNDCDGATDEEAPTDWYPDADGDGHGVPGGAIVTCDPPPGYADVADDCDDGNAARFPSATEACDVVDNDCDTRVDEAADAACAVERGTGACASGECGITSCASGFADCDGVYATGCEVNVTSNPRHCGGCGMACALGDTCGRGASGSCDGSRITGMTAGEAHTFVLRSTGGLVGWGDNNQGQVGTGGTTDVSVASFVLPDVAQVSAGADHSCAVGVAGRVRCWGDNASSQLGDGTTTDSTGPIVVPGLAGVRQVGAGDAFSCALLDDGTVWCWGDRRFGQVGDGVLVAGNPARTPTQVLGVNDAVELSVGSWHACVRRPRGGGGFRVQCWGRNHFGQLGVGTSGDASNTANASDVLGLVGDPVAFANGFSERTCVQLSTGTLRCWGRNGFGAVGNGTISQDRPESTPQVVTDTSGFEAAGIVASCSGTFLTCVLRDVGTPGAYSVWCAGADDFGQLGDGDTTRSDSGRLRQVVDPSGAAPFVDATAIGCGRNHACAARANGTVHCWGNDDGQNLGNGGGTIPRNNPTPLPVVGL